MIAWSDEAKETTRDIYAKLLEESSVYAENWLTELEHKLELLEQFPEMGRQVPEFGLSFIREVFVKKYRLVYSYLNQNITIVAIRPMGRPLGRI
ncbi:type II toxin-antitoxin system RelE/ParE family toxin [Tellurirhabdus rosea]|uniref:type II toxin-antitoxin system RelE/ParE family toxin n=1 Tax=Tellurirhabdus rosea TaxID=2674997 RepID=UPI0022573812|nr:type II toxin-antitoxin system RelE/ParE family toxin [Tellurirhabdus rosea]